MNIQEATREASERGVGMRRINDEWAKYASDVAIIPTNTSCYCIVAYCEMKDDASHRWTPTLNDLLADDWIVVY